MGNPNQKCSICSAPLEVRQCVDAAIRSREKFRDLAARTPFSSSALNRHARKCIGKSVLNAYKAKSAAVAGRYLVRWPEDAAPDVAGKCIPMGRDQAIPPEELRPNDIVFVVRYRQTEFADYKNPAALNTDDLHNQARAENAEREAAV